MLLALLASLWDHTRLMAMACQLENSSCKDQQIHGTSLMGMIWTCLDLFAIEAQAPPTSTRD